MTRIVAAGLLVLALSALAACGSRNQRETARDTAAPASSPRTGAGNGGGGGGGY